MKKIVFFCGCFLFLISCKFNENSGNNTEKETIVTDTKELKSIQGKVVDRKGKRIAYAAVKLYLDEDDCMNAYTDNEGLFKFKVDELRIKDQSHFEVVYKGYAIKMLSLRNFVNDRSIILDKKGKLVSVVDYRVFYESIKSCGRQKTK